ncbi:MAG: Gfo/Idh/MocA family protein [Candidatus Poribacteria bacterium]
MRLAVIGLAGVGAKHVSVVSNLENAELACVCDIASNIADDFANKYKTKAYYSVEDMIEKEIPDGVIVATPPKSHYPIAKICAEKGIHVFVEKPMASYVSDCQKMIDVCKENNVTLMVGHKKRFVPALIRLKELTQGELGEIKFMIHRYPHPWMSLKDWFWAEDDGGGPILENAVHAADILGFLMGDVDSVYAEGDSFFAEQRKPQINCAVYTLRFKSGAIATVGAGMVSIPAFSFEDFFIATDNGVAEVSGHFDSVEKIRYAFRKDPNNAKEEIYSGVDAFVEEIRHFIECSRTKKEPIASGEAGKKAVAICRAIKKSAEIGEPVKII